MQYQSYQKSDSYITLWAEVPSASGTVTMKLLKQDDSLETLSNSTCSGSGVLTDLYYWNTSDVTTQPASMTEYVYWMEDVAGRVSEAVKIVIGGYVDDVDDIYLTVSGTDVKVDDLITTISGIDTAVTDIGSVVTGSDTKIDSVYSTVSGTEVKIDELITTISGVETKVDGIDLVVTDSNNKINVIYPTVSGIDVKADTIGADVVSVETKVDEVDLVVNSTEIKVDGIITTISGIDTKVDGIITTISGIDVRVLLIKKCHTNRLELADGYSNNWILYDDDNSTPLLTFSVTDKNGSSIVQQANIPSKRSKAV